MNANDIALSLINFHIDPLRLSSRLARFSSSEQTPFLDTPEWKTFLTAVTGFLFSENCSDVLKKFVLLLKEESFVRYF